MKLYKFEVVTILNTKKQIALEATSENEARAKFRGNERFVTDFNSKTMTNVSHIVDVDFVGTENREANPES